VALPCRFDVRPLRFADYAAEQEEEVCALQAILMDDIEGAPPLQALGSCAAALADDAFLALGRRG
jgi:hypothetical protein